MYEKCTPLSDLLLHLTVRHTDMDKQSAPGIRRVKQTEWLHLGRGSGVKGEAGHPK